MGASFDVVLRRAVSWLIIVQAILLGMLTIAVFGGTWEGGAVPLAEGTIPILLSLIATRNPRRASHIALWVAPITLLLIFPSPWGFRAAVLVFAGSLVIPGLFWLLTSRRNWPLPLQFPLIPRRPYLGTILGLGMLCALVVIAVLSSLFLPWWPPIGDCSVRPLLTEQGAPRNIDFTARIVFVGPRSFHERSLWSIARVQQRFADPSSAPPDLLILRAYFLPNHKSQHYFVAA